MNGWFLGNAFVNFDRRRWSYSIPHVFFLKGHDFAASPVSRQRGLLKTDFQGCWGLWISVICFNESRWGGSTYYVSCAGFGGDFFFGQKNWSMTRLSLNMRTCSSACGGSPATQVQELGWKKMSPSKGTKLWKLYHWYNRVGVAWVARMDLTTILCRKWSMLSYIVILSTRLDGTNSGRNADIFSTPCQSPGHQT